MMKLKILKCVKEFKLEGLKHFYKFWSEIVSFLYANFFSYIIVSNSSDKHHQKNKEILQD